MKIMADQLENEVFQEEIDEQGEISEMLDVTESQNNNIDDDDGLFNKVDDLWMLSEDEAWELLQNSIKSLCDVVGELEGSVQEGYDELSSKINGVEKHEIETTENLLKKFNARWETKCKETENLRVSLKRATHESTRINDEYHEMEDSVSKMRQQFGMAIDSSVTEIEELAICNNSLSERIQDLEAKTKRGERNFKQNAKDNLDSLRQIIKLTEQDDATVKTIRNKLSREADKIDRMIVVDDLFETGQSSESNLTEKSQKMVDAISQGLVETLKRELAESRNISDTQKRRIKDMEREKEEFLQNQLAAKNEGVNEMNELIDYLRKSIIQRKPEYYRDNPEISNVKRNFNIIRKLVFTLQNGIDKSYKQVATKSGSMLDMKDNIREINDKLKEYACQIDSLTEERDFYKTKHEQIDNQYRISNDELNTIQHRLKAIDSERKVLFDENLGLKSGKANIQDFCSNLSGENDKLLDKLKSIQDERDRTFENLQEQLDRINYLSNEKNEVEHKAENLEHVILKLRREYQDQTREVSMLSKENEDLKRSIQDSEEERHKIRRSMKSVETGNKDLEDQLFQLTSELQKHRSDYSKLKQTSEEHQNNVKDLNEKIDMLEKYKAKAILMFNENEKEAKTLKEDLKTVKLTLKENNEITGKKKSLLCLYEKLMIKLLHQRKEILQDVHHGVEDDEIPSVLCSTLSLDYKNQNEIEMGFAETTKYVDRSFTRFKSFLTEKTNEQNYFVSFSRELSECLSEIDEYDSCYSTENDDQGPFVPGRVSLEGRKGLNALKGNSKFELDCSTVLIGKLKKFISYNKTKYTDYTNMNKRNLFLKKKINCLLRKLKFSKLVANKLKTTIKKQNNAIKHLKMYELKHKEEKLLKKDDDIISRNVENNTEEKSISQNICVCSVDKKAEKTHPDQLDERLEVIQDQRQYMLEHLTFTNKRLEVLLDVMKGKEKENTESDPIPAPLIHNPYSTKRVLKRVRDTFKSDENVLKRAVSILELTKAISVTNLTELEEDKAINEDHREMIVLVKDLNENMDSILREARTNISSTSPRRVLAANEIATQHQDENKDKEKKVPEDEVIPKSEFIKKENELKTSLEKAQKKVEDLSTFLAKREHELKERDEIIAQLNTEYENLKNEATNKNDINIATRDRIIQEYKLAKQRLEQANSFLQHVVKELREELLKFQKNYRIEEETQKHLEEFVQELQTSKKTLEASLDKMGYELNIVQKDRERLLASFQNLNTQNSYLSNCCSSVPPPYHVSNQYSNAFNQMEQNYPGNIVYSSNGRSLNNNVTNPIYTSDFNHSNQYHQNTCSMGECNCGHTDISVSTNFPYSEDDIPDVASYDEFESLPSDQEDVISSSGSHTTSTSSKIAKNIKTSEATDCIKAQNRPEIYLRTERHTAKPLLSPRSHQRIRGRSLGNEEQKRVSHSGNSLNRVVGRREQIHSSSSNRRSSQDSQSSSSMRSPEPNIRRLDPKRFSLDSRRKQYEHMQIVHDTIEIGNNKYETVNDMYYAKNNRRIFNQDSSQASGYETANDSFGRGNVNYHGEYREQKQLRTEVAYRNPVVDIDTAIERAAIDVEKSYLQEQKELQSKNILDASFLTSKLDGKKKKKRFLGFTKK